MCFDFLYNLCLKYFSFNIKFCEISKTDTVLYKVPVIFVRFQRILNFLGRYSRSTQISNFMKIRPVGAELFYADGRMDGQTDVTKLIVAFLNFVKAP